MLLPLGSLPLSLPGHSTKMACHYWHCGDDEEKSEGARKGNRPSSPPFDSRRGLTIVLLAQIKLATVSRRNNGETAKRRKKAHRGPIYSRGESVKDALICISKSNARAVGIAPISSLASLALNSFAIYYCLRTQSFPLSWLRNVPPALLPLLRGKKYTLYVILHYFLLQL